MNHLGNPRLGRTSCKRSFHTPSVAAVNMPSAGGILTFPRLSATAVKGDEVMHCLWHVSPGVGLAPVIVVQVPATRSWCALFRRSRPARRHPHPRLGLPPCRFFFTLILRPCPLFARGGAGAVGDVATACDGAIEQGPWARSCTQGTTWDHHPSRALGPLGGFG